MGDADDLLGAPELDDIEDDIAEEMMKDYNFGGGEGDDAVAKGPDGKPKSRKEVRNLLSRRFQRAGLLMADFMLPLMNSGHGRDYCQEQGLQGDEAEAEGGGRGRDGEAGCGLPTAPLHTCPGRLCETKGIYKVCLREL